MSDAETVAEWRAKIGEYVPITKEDEKRFEQVQRLVTLAECYLLLRDETSHLEFTARGVHYYTGEGQSLDAVLEIARKGGGE